MADSNEHARVRADARGVPFFTDHRALLAAVQPEVAVIMTPHPAHPPIAMDALAAGAHVLVEKPMAIQVADADAMIEAAARAGRLLAVNFQQRARPEIRAAPICCKAARWASSNMPTWLWSGRDRGNTSVFPPGVAPGRAKGAACC